jgi:photosystem II stability/assembly factor-like uncharacterized protein
MRWIRLGILFLTAASAAHAGVNSWSPIGPYGGLVTGIAIDPSNPATAYASSTSALYKSTDSGITWSLLPKNFGTYPLRDVQIDPAHPTRLYVVAIGSGLFRSTDGGATFTRLSAAPTDANTDGPTTLALSTDGNTLYYSTIGNLFFRSTDSGTTFTQVHDTPATAHQLVVDPNDSHVIYGAGTTQLIKSEDGGDTWRTLPLPQPPIAPVAENHTNSVVLVPGSPNTIWLAANRVYSTTDDGAHWTQASTLLDSNNLFADPASPGALYAIPGFSGGTVMHYTSGGAWQALSPQMPAVVGKLAFSPGNPQSVFAATTNGIFRTTNINSAQWAHSDAGFTGAKAGAFAITAGRLYAGTWYGELGVTADESPMLTKVVTSDLTPPYLWQMTSLGVQEANPNVIVAGFAEAGYRYTTDGGASWHDGSSYLHDAFFDALAVDPDNESVMFAATRRGPSGPIDSIQRSGDGGQTFSPVPSSLGMGQVTTTRLAVDPQKSSRLFLSAEEFGGTNGFFRSVDSGVTWTNLLPNTPVWDFAFVLGNSSRLFAATGNLVVTNDSGDTFTPSASLPSAALGNTIAVATDPTYSAGVYALNVNYTGPVLTQVPEYFLMRSVDDGASWERIANSTIPNWSPTKIAVDAQFPGVIAVATADSGVHLFHISPDLSLAIVGHSDTKPIGVPSSYDVKAQNLGPLAATVVHLSSTFPAGAQSVSASVPNGSCAIAATTVQCTIPYLKVNDTVSAHVTYTPPAAGKLTVQASVSAREDDPVANNNSATASATATETVDLSVTGSATPSTMTRGAAFSYSFQVQNAGPNDSSATQLTIAAPNGVTVSSTTPSTCSVSVGTVTCNLGALAALATAKVTVAATATNSGTQRATATVTHATTAVDTNANNDAANVDIVSNDPPASTASGGGGGGGGSLSLDVIFVLMLIALASAHRRRVASLPSPSAGGR